MIRCEALETFTLGRFDELTDIERAGMDEKGKLNKRDKFTCPKDLADYLLGGNRFNKAFVKVIEIIPEIKPIPNAKEEAEIKPIPNAKIDDVKITPLVAKKSLKKKSSKK